MKERWIADFSKPEKSCFDIKPEISYDAYLEKGSLFIGLKKKNCMAWLETVNRVYVDQIIEARFRFDSHGSYCAAGIMFRIASQGYYLALVSSKGYFRLDAVHNNISKPLIGWTETPHESAVNLGIIARGDHLIFLINDKWIAEAYDASIPGGHLGFALVSYDEDLNYDSSTPSLVIKDGYHCRSWLNYLSVDARAGSVEAEHEKWDNSVMVNAESRFRLAESFAALECYNDAYNQMLKAWRQREAAARSVMATYTEIRAKDELLFASQMAMRLGHYEKAEEYIDVCLAMCASGAEKLKVLAEKAQNLSAQHKYGDLAAFLPDYIQQAEAGSTYADVPSLYALLGHACWNLHDYPAAAAAWSKAFSLDGNNGLYAANAANAFELIGKNRNALRCSLDAAHCFLQQEDFTEMGALIPRLLALGKNNKEAQTLAEKLASATGNDNHAHTDLALSDGIKRPRQPRAKKPGIDAKPARTKAKTVAVASITTVTDAVALAATVTAAIAEITATPETPKPKRKAAAKPRVAEKSTPVQKEAKAKAKPATAAPPKTAAKSGTAAIKKTTVKKTASPAKEAQAPKKTDTGRTRKK